MYLFYSIKDFVKHSFQRLYLLFPVFCFLSPFFTPCFAQWSPCYTSYATEIFYYQETYQLCNSGPRLQAIYDDATLLYLDDGSLWKIETCEAHKTQDWLSGDEIRIERTGSRLFPFALVNAASDTRVYATLKAQPIRNFASDSYSQQIQQNIDEGDLILLADASLWEIAPMSTYQARLWQPGDHLQVCRSQNNYYPYLLINTKTKEFIEARLKTAM